MSGRATFSGRPGVPKAENLILLCQPGGDRWSSGFSLGRLAVVVVDAHSQTGASGLLIRRARRLKPELQRQAGKRDVQNSAPALEWRAGARVFLLYCRRYFMSRVM
jgi:hypothetical protein